MTESEFFVEFSKIVGVDHLNFELCLSILTAREKLRVELYKEQRNNWREVHKNAYNMAIKNFESNKEGMYLTRDQVRVMTIAELAEFSKDDCWC